MKYYNKKNSLIVFVKEKATPNFWDKLWNDNELKKTIEGGRKKNLVSKITKTYIEPGKNKRILEGGCGKGIYVYSLNQDGYDAYGVDFAPKIVSKIRKIFPDLKITCGNVEKLEFSDDFFDGYWSLGVIEHFYDGYDKIAMEMNRIIKPGGYLFLTFPYMSPLRKLKAKMGKYEDFSEKNFEKNNFYQFALDHKKVVGDFQNLGFQLVKTRPFDGMKGLKDEVALLRPILQKVYDSKNMAAKIISAFVSLLLSPLSPHSILLVLKKND